QSASLLEAIATPGDEIRDFLGGPMRRKLVSLLTDANDEKAHIFAALFELNDPELVRQLKKFRGRAHILLSNGAAQKGKDANADARSELERSGCNVIDRTTSPSRLAHNSFLIICGSDRSPRLVWSSSTGWTKTGLCLAATSALLI